MWKPIALLLVVLACCVCADPVVADTSTLVATHDTTIGPGISDLGAIIYGLYLGVAYVGESTDLGTMRYLVQFGPLPIPARATVVSAKLRAHLTGTSSEDDPGDTLELSVHRLTQGWEEGSATWSRMAQASDSRAHDTQACDVFTRWVEWDVTELVRYWHSGTAPNHGLAIHGPASAPERYRVFTTKEGSSNLAAQLVIEWVMPSPTPSRTATATRTPPVTMTPTHTPTLPIHYLRLPLVMR